MLRDVRVPAGHLLGAWGDGFALAQARLGPGRVHHCMRTHRPVRAGAGAGLRARAGAQAPSASALAEQANVQEWLADSRLEIDQARLLVLRTAWALDQPAAAADLRDARSRRSRWWRRGCRRACVDRAIQVFGAMGLSPDTPLAALWTWGRALRIMDGPDEVHLRTVARGELRRAAERRGRWPPTSPRPSSWRRRRGCGDQEVVFERSGAAAAPERGGALNE